MGAGALGPAEAVPAVHKGKLGFGLPSDGIWVLVAEVFGSAVGYVEGEGVAVGELAGDYRSKLCGQAEYGTFRHLHVFFFCRSRVGLGEGCRGGKASSRGSCSVV